ncbi:MAG: hypothetical protein ACTS2F_16895 [Thainema sp.]
MYPHDRNRIVGLEKAGLAVALGCIVAGLLQIWFDGMAGWFLRITGLGSAMSGSIAIAFVLAAFRLLSGAIGGAVQN